MAQIIYKQNLKMISNKNIFDPSETQVPSDWPYRKNSKMVRVDNFLWHAQIFENVKKKQRPFFFLIHGTGGAVHSWRHTVETLYAEADLIAIDLPGHGFTQETDKIDYSLVTIARLLKNLIEVLEIEIIDLVIGHSAGAAIAIELCIQTHSKKIKHLIGLNPSLVPPPASYNFLLNPLIKPIASSNGFTSFLSLITQNTSLIENLLSSTGSKLNLEQEKLYKRILAKNDHLKGAIKFMASTNLFELLDKSRNLKTKSTFILGKEDPWIQIEPLKKIIEKYFPNSQVIENSGGHLMHETHSLKISDQILKIFNES